MEFGTAFSGFVTGLREGVEAALIVSIILAYLSKTGNAHFFPRIWLGTIAAVGFSALAGVALYVSVGELPEPYEQIFEGLTLLVASAVVTWMLFWMRRQSALVKGDLHARLQRIITDGGAWSLVVLAFTAVIREGIETALFLVGQVTAVASADGGAAGILLGAVVGLALATALGYGFYRGSRRLNLAVFFRWTGIVLVFIAAGLLGGAVHEFAEIGAIPFGTQPAYDLSGILPHESGIGQFLAALFGYSSRPEVTRVVVQGAYLVVALALYLRPIVPATPRAAATGAPARS